MGTEHSRHRRLAVWGYALVSTLALACSLLDPLDGISGGTPPSPTAPPPSASDGGPPRGVEAGPTEVRDAAPPYEPGDAGYTDLSGSWSGTWKQDYVINGGTVKMQLVQDGGTFVGTGEVTGGGCPSRGTLTGRFVAADKTESKFTSEDGAFVFEWDCQLSADTKTLTGRFASVGNCWPGVSGSTTITRP